MLLYLMMKVRKVMKWGKFEMDDSTFLIIGLFLLAAIMIVTGILADSC